MAGAFGGLLGSAIMGGMDGKAGLADWRCVISFPIASESLADKPKDGSSSLRARLLYQSQLWHALFFQITQTTPSGSLTKNAS
jgi:hypothetical protein